MAIKVNPKRKHRVPRHLKAQVDKAGTSYKGFHWGKESQSLRKKKASKKPDVGMKLGELASVTYQTRKGNEKADSYYEHEFGEEGGAKPELVLDIDNDKLHIVGGDYVVTDAGIKD